MSTDPRRAIDRRIGRLALPAVLTIAAEPVYELTDTAVLGHLGRDALGGAALASALLVNGYAVFIFLLYGTTAIVARLRGAGRHAAAAHHSVQALWVAVVAGSVVGLALWPASPALIRWAGGTNGVGDAALTYFRTSLLGLPAFFMVMAGAGARRGIQDLRTPLVITVVSVASNLVSELVLIVGLGFGVGASAATTVLAKWGAAIVYVVLVGRDARARGVTLRPDRAAVRAVSSAGVPLLIRTIALRATMTLAITVAGRMGEVDLAAYAIALGISSTLAYLLEGLEVAAQTLIGTALGAGETASATLVAARVVRLGAVVGTADMVVIVLLHRLLPSLFTPDPAVREAASTSLLWVAAMQPVASVSYALDGVLIGAGDLRFLAAAMPIAAVGFAVLAAVVIVSGAGLAALWASMIAFMVMRAVLLGRRLTGGRWTAPRSPAVR